MCHSAFFALLFLVCVQLYIFRALISRERSDAPRKNKKVDDDFVRSRSVHRNYYPCSHFILSANTFYQLPANMEFMQQFDQR